MRRPRQQGNDRPPPPSEQHPKWVMDLVALFLAAFHESISEYAMDRCSWARGQTRPPRTVRDVDRFVQQANTRTLDDIKRVANANGVQWMFDGKWIDGYTVGAVAQDCFLVWHEIA